MFKPVNFKTLPQDFLKIQLGFAVFGLSIAFIILAQLGANPWVMLTVALSDITGLSEGIITQLTGVVVLFGALLMREPVGWGTLGNILFIGPWLDLFLWLLPTVPDQIVLQIVVLLLGILLMGLASGIYISVNAGAGPRDSLMLGLERITGWSIRWTRSLIELCVFVVAFLLGGPAGVGTIAIALLIGPAVQWGFKLCGVERK